MMAEVYEDITFRATALFHGESYCIRVRISGVARRRRRVGAMNFRKRNFHRFPKIGERFLKIPARCQYGTAAALPVVALLSKCQI